MQLDTDKLRRTASAVYLATDKPIADDISKLLLASANEIDLLRLELNLLVTRITSLATDAIGIYDNLK